MIRKLICIQCYAPREMSEFDVKKQTAKFLTPSSNYIFFTWISSNSFIQLYWIIDSTLSLTSSDQHIFIISYHCYLILTYRSLFSFFLSPKDFIYNIISFQLNNAHRNLFTFLRFLMIVDELFPPVYFRSISHFINLVKESRFGFLPLLSHYFDVMIAMHRKFVHGIILTQKM